MFPRNIEPFPFPSSYRRLLCHRPRGGREGCALPSDRHLLVSGAVGCCIFYFFALVFCLVHPKIDSSFSSTCSLCLTRSFPPPPVLAFLVTASVLRRMKRRSLPIFDSFSTIDNCCIEDFVVVLVTARASCPRPPPRSKQHPPPPP